ncbi:MAG TPA: hypothetical protein VI790_04850 [Candidatus Nanoarchaeia archaeon]|nr:hypothetical protein [Candidatus Nanoarchaeia archaeon]
MSLNETIKKIEQQHPDWKKLNNSVNWILKLEDNYDLEGNKPPTKKLIKTALEHIPIIIKIIKEKTGKTINTEPKIQPYGNGLDILWDNNEQYLLLTTQEEMMDTALFNYTDNENKLRGYFDSKTKETIFL